MVSLSTWNKTLIYRETDMLCYDIKKLEFFYSVLRHNCWLRLWPRDLNLNIMLCVHQDSYVRRCIITCASVHPYLVKPTQFKDGKQLSMHTVLNSASYTNWYILQIVVKWLLMWLYSINYVHNSSKCNI